EKGAGHIRIFGGGGGTILHSEIEELHNYGITRLYAPEDGRTLGLTGMIKDVLSKCDFLPTESVEDIDLNSIEECDYSSIARTITYLENFPEETDNLIQQLKKLASGKKIPVLGITGTGGAGKSSLTDELVRRFLSDFEDKKVAILSVDPSKRKTGGALLGDRIRMNSIYDYRVYMRSFATRQAHVTVNKTIVPAINTLKAANFDLIIVETAGIGQSDSAITEIADVSVYAMTPEYGAATQLEKIDMIDHADLIALNKFDKRGAEDAKRDVQKQYQRGHQLWDTDVSEMPVYGTIASQFNDPGTNTFYRTVID
ncbi:MAG: methylmalonyl-CoA mutase, partial [candidate division Zixibacteria bacterium]|nr:methylmalonyl-CoA mutase [candidate division Zixibacteria bacterium]